MPRRKKGDKAKAQEKHAIRRLRERFGIELKQHEYDHLCAQIRRGEEFQSMVYQLKSAAGWRRG